MRRQMIRVLTATAAMVIVAAQPAMAASWGYNFGGNGQCKVIVGGNICTQLQSLMGQNGNGCGRPGAVFPETSCGRYPQRWQWTGQASMPDVLVPNVSCQTGNGNPSSGGNQAGNCTPDIGGCQDNHCGDDGGNNNGNAGNNNGNGGNNNDNGGNNNDNGGSGSDNGGSGTGQGSDDNSSGNNDGSHGNNDGQDSAGAQDAWTQQVVDLVNAERKKAGLRELAISDGAASAAQVRANEITRSFSHTRPNGSSFGTALNEAGVSYTGCGENIAYGQNSPQAVMNQWMNSASHRANILNSQFTAIGVGHYRDNAGTDYWTQLFIR